MNADATLRAQALSVDIEGDAGIRRVVDALTLTIARGETLALVGESGSGKSLTALALMRLLPESAAIVDGRVTLADLSVLDLPEHRMRALRGGRIGIVFQEPSTSLNPVMPIGEQLVEAIETHTALRGGAARQRAIEWLTRVGLPEPARRIADPPFRLSGGQKQRVMIAMALAAEPDFLLADEPTTALDVTLQAQILDLLQSLQRERGLGMLLITHDLAVASQRADRIALMRGGQLVELAEAKTFFTSPKHPYAQALMAALPGRHPSPVRVEPVETPRAPPQSAAPVELVETALAPRPVLLDVQHLHVHFDTPRGLFRPRRSVHAVNDVSFDVRTAETVALVGESGSGKTTTGKAIVQLLRRQATTEGRALVDGHDLFTLQGEALRRARRDVQIVFQDPFASLDPRMRVADILDEGLVSLCPELDAPAREDRIHGLIRRVGLDVDTLQRHPHEFSGGQRQRIAIARALSVGPRLIVCDEPTSALDVSVQAQVLALLTELQRELSVSYLFITHNLAVVEEIAHRMLVMRHGCVVESGDVAQVLHAPRDPYTRMLLSAVPRLDAR